GILGVLQVLQEPLARVDRANVERHALAEERDDLLRLVLPEEAVVDEDAGEPLTDRLVDERRDDGRVDAAREPADDAAVPYPLPDARHPALDEALHRPVRLGLADAEDEVPQDVLPVH